MWGIEGKGTHRKCYLEQHGPSKREAVQRMREDPRVLLRVGRGSQKGKNTLELRETSSSPPMDSDRMGEGWSLHEPVLWFSGTEGPRNRRICYETGV